MGNKDHHVCVRNGAGKIVDETRCRTDHLGRFLAVRTPARSVPETCSEAFRIAGAAGRQRPDVRVVAAAVAPSRDAGQRGVK